MDWEPEESEPEGRTPLKAVDVTLFVLKRFIKRRNKNCTLQGEEILSQRSQESEDDDDDDNNEQRSPLPQEESGDEVPDGYILI